MIPETAKFFIGHFNLGTQEKSQINKNILVIIYRESTPSIPQRMETPLSIPI